jgi:hypothetical protein
VPSFAHQRVDKSLSLPNDGSLPIRLLDAVAVLFRCNSKESFGSLQLADMADDVE